MTTLRLYLEEGWPDRQRACDWALLDAGRVVGRGRSAPEHWPAADDVEAMLDPVLVGSYTVKLPGGVRQDSERLAAYALEDQLVEDPERYRCAVGDTTPSGTRVLALPRSRLTALADALATLGRTANRMVAAADLLSRDEHEWLLWQNPAGAITLHTSGGACPVANPADLAPLLAGSSHTRVRILAATDVAVAWQAAVPGASIVAESTIDWAAGDWRGAINLLGGDFRAPRSAGRWRRPILWASVALGLATVMVIGDWAGLAWRRDGLLSELRDTARTALPGQAIVAPLTQLTAATDRAAHRQGASGFGDFLVLAERAAPLAAPGEVQEINYETGHLTMQLARLDSRQEAEAGQALTMAGLELRVARQANAVRVSIGIETGGARP